MLSIACAQGVQPRLGLARLWRLHRGRGWSRRPELETCPRGSRVLQQHLVHVIDRVAEAEVLLQHELGRPDQVQAGASDPDALLAHVHRVLVLVNGRTL